MTRRSASIRLCYPAITDPREAIAFALEADDLDFLRIWHESDWATIADEWPEYLERIK